MGIIIENSKQEKNYTFDIKIVEKFINEVSDKIKKELNDI